MLVKDRVNWWNNTSTMKTLPADSLANFEIFLDNIQNNFAEDTDAYQQITEKKHAEKHLETLLQSILSYQDDLLCWKTLLNG